MRTKEIKIGGEKKTAVLVAGGQGFKIYTVADIDGWIIVIGVKTHLIPDFTKDSPTVSNYVNLHYHSPKLKESIINKFSTLVRSLNN